MSRSLADHCTELRTLDLSECQLSNFQLMALARAAPRLPKLATLDLSYAEPPSLWGHHDSRLDW